MLFQGRNIVVKNSQFSTRVNLISMQRKSKNFLFVNKSEQSLILIVRVVEAGMIDVMTDSRCHER